MLLTLFLSALSLLSCDSQENSEQSYLPQEEMSLTLGAEEIQIDSLSAELGMNNIITTKIYCTSGYPLTDTNVARRNELMFIKLRSKLSVGKSIITSSKDYETKYISYELDNGGVTTGSPRGSTREDIHWIEILAVDNENKRFSIEMQTTEYMSFMDRLLGKKPEQLVTFKGENIKFVELY